MSQNPYIMPGSDLDLADPAVVTDLLNQTAELNRSDPKRTACVVDLPDRGQLLATGDLHDNAPALQRVIKRARLDQSPDHHVVLHELIHGPTRLNGMDFSIRTLARACAVKLAYPEQVHFLLSNHELAQRRQEHVFKEGGSDVDAFNEGLAHLFGDDEALLVHEAFNAYVDSLLLAVRCANGVMVAHSLPSPRKITSFDKAVLQRQLEEADYAANGAAHLMVWGRHQNEKIAQELAEAWSVSTFVLGHQSAEMGWDEKAHNILILNSDHSHGVCLPIDLSQPVTRDALSEHAVPINGIRFHDGDEQNAFGAVSKAVCVLTPTNNTELNSVYGTVTFTQTKSGLLIEADVTGLTPNSKHGLHVHQWGDLSSSDGNATGGHYDPQAVGTHGLPDVHAHGDIVHAMVTGHAGGLGNLETDDQGNATYSMTFENISLTGYNALLGRSIIIHLDEDTGEHQDEAESIRVAQGVIGIADPE
eukprot:g12930.t1